VRVFCEGNLVNPGNADVLTPMVRVYLSPWHLESEPAERQAARVVAQLQELEPGRRGLSVEWILARVMPTHGLPDSSASNVARQMIAGEWDVEAEAERLAPIGEAIAAAHIPLDFVYTNREGLMGPTWDEAMRPAIDLALASRVFVRRLPPVLRSMLQREGSGPLFNAVRSGDQVAINPRFDRGMAARFNAWFAEMGIRAVRETLRRAGILQAKTVAVQSWAISPVREREGGWRRYDSNPMMQRATVDGYTGNDQEYFTNGAEFEKARWQGKRWEWCALVNAVANARSHLGPGRMLPGSGIAGFVPTVSPPGLHGGRDGTPEKTRWVLTREYLKHVVAGGVNTIGLFNPEGTTRASEDQFAKFIREVLLPLQQPSPAGLPIPGDSESWLMTQGVDTQAGGILRVSTTCAELVRRLEEANDGI
jgi:hypothetical protein